MTFYIEPPTSFYDFDKNILRRGHNMQVMAFLIRYCGYSTLPKDCWLYEELQKWIRQKKFAGLTESKRWITYPDFYSNDDVMEPRLMRVNTTQMQRWAQFLQAKCELITRNCCGRQWEQYYSG